MSSELQISVVQEADIGALAEFLRSTFHTPADWAPFRPDVLHWKCLARHPLWSGTCGYLIRSGDAIVAHGCAMPCRFVSQSAYVLGSVIIDWSASRAVPGGGVLIYQHIGKAAQCLFGVGGSDDAQRILPRMGFKPRQEFLTYTRVVKPLALFAETQQKSWKTPAHLARNVLRGMQTAGASPGTWSATPVARFDESLASVLPKAKLVSESVCERDSALLNYFLQCPAARMEAHLLHQDGKLTGYFILARLRRECRIAELWVEANSEEDWASAYTVAAERAAAGEDVVQIVTGCSTPVLARAIEHAGFHLTGRQPVYFKDPESLLPPQTDISMSMLATDAFYL